MKVQNYGSLFLPLKSIKGGKYEENVQSAVHDRSKSAQVPEQKHTQLNIV